MRFQRILATMTLVGAVGTSVASAQDAAPAPAPSAAPYRLLQRGPTFVSVGGAVASRVRSEFAPSGTSGMPSFDGWTTSESTLFGRYRVASFTDYRSLSFTHGAVDPVPVIGASGTVRVRTFRVHDDELESGGGVEIARGVFAGLSLVKRQENSGLPPLHGVAYVVGFVPNADAAVAPYGWVSYAPNMGGPYQLANGATTAVTYRAVRSRAGVLLRERGTRLYLDLGVTAEWNGVRTNAAAPMQSVALDAGIGFRI